MPPDLILASQSPSRAALLRAAGLVVETIPAGVDEASVKASLAAEQAPPRDVADTLAELKALRVGAKFPDALVLGADQVLACDGALFDKPESLEEAAEHLRKLRGRTHELFAAAVIVRGGAPIWRHVGRVGMTMRPFSDEFLAEYLESQDADLLDTVGAYRLEGAGAQLFSRVDGDYFSVLGLPLLECLGFLRAQGVCLT